MSAHSYLSVLALALASVASVLGAEVLDGLNLVRAQPPITLPDFVVKGDAVWRYARSEHFEILSLASEHATKRFVGEVERQLAMIPAILPPGFLPQSDVPAVLILHAREDALEPGSGGLNFASNWLGAMLSDAKDYDVPVFFTNVAWLDKNDFVINTDRASPLVTPSKYVSWLMDCRKPRPPPWLSFGFEVLMRKEIFCSDGIKYIPPKNFGGTTAKQREDLESSDKKRIEDQRAPLPEMVWQQSDLRALLERWPVFSGSLGEVSPKIRQDAWGFVFWGLMDPEYTSRFWTFVKRASEERVDEIMFRECFGLGYAATEQRILAIKQRWEDSHPDMRVVLARTNVPLERPELRLRVARPAEIARLLGEWRRQMALLNENPQQRAAALDAARISIAQPLPKNERDAGLLATLGLCERDGGRNEEAYEHLSRATQLGVVRPRAYLEFSRIGHERAVRALTSAEQKFSEAQTRAIIEPLMRAHGQSPALQGVYELMCEVWDRSSSRPGPADLSALAEGARRFPRNTRLMAATVRLLNDNGEKAQAADIANRWLKLADEQTRKSFGGASHR